MKNIGEKIKVARQLHEKWGMELRSDPWISDRLRTLSLLARESAGACIESGVALACRACEEERGGSCCGAGIEDHFTPGGLLINLMLGVNLIDSKYSEESCHFLTPLGCGLVSRDVLCINYLCLRVQKEIGPEKLALLQAANGREIDTLFPLHDRICRFIRQVSA